MPMGEFTNTAAEEALEKLREMFNEIPADKRKDSIHAFSTVGTFIQAAQRHMKPMCGSTPNGDSRETQKENSSANTDGEGGSLFGTRNRTS